MLNQFSIRPRSLGEILDDAIRIYRNNFWTMLGIVALIQLPIVLLSYFILANSFQNLLAVIQDPLTVTSPATSLWITLASYANSLASAVFIQFANAALSYAVAARIFGRKLTFGTAYRHALSRWQSILGLAFLVTAFNIFLGILFVLLFFTIVGWIAGLGAWIFFSYGVMPFLIPILILEDESAWAVIGRAWRLIRDHFWEIMRFGIVILALIMIIQLGPTALFAGILALIFSGGSLDPDTAVTIAISTGAASTALISIFILPYRAIAYNLLYLDLRVRDEGLDLLIKSTGQQITDDPISLLANAPKAVSQGKTIRGSDIKRGFGLGFLSLALIIGFYAFIFGIAFIAISMMGY